MDNASIKTYLLSLCLFGIWKEVLIKGLAESRTFQRFAVRTNKQYQDLTKQGAEQVNQTLNDLAKQQALVEYYEMCVDTCERYMKNISDRQWNIKNAIAWRKFESGEI